MSAFSESPEASYVLMRLGPAERDRFAVPAQSVEELASASRVEKFPHKTPGLDGVIVRRKRVYAVRDVASLLIGRALVVHRFYLIVRRNYGKAVELEAIPVSGDCELLAGAVALPPSDGAPEYFAGSIDLGGVQIPLLDMEKLAAATSAIAAPVGSRA